MRRLRSGIGGMLGFDLSTGSRGRGECVWEVVILRKLWRFVEYNQSLNLQHCRLGDWCASLDSLRARVLAAAKNRDGAVRLSLEGLMANTGSFHSLGWLLRQLSWARWRQHWLDSCLGQGRIFCRIREAIRWFLTNSAMILK